MVALPVIDDTTRVAFLWRNGASGPTAVNVMHFGTASTDMAALNTAINANVTQSMWAGVVNTAAVYQLTMTPLDGTTATQLFSQTGTKWIGQNAAPDYTPALAQVVSLRTAKRGRRYRGRLYLPFTSEGFVTAGTASAALTTQQAAWDAFRTAMATSSFPIVVATYGHSLKRTKTPGGGYVLTPVTWAPDSTNVNSILVEGTMGTQRRRQSRTRV